MIAPSGLSIGKCEHGYGVFAVRSFVSREIIAMITGGRVVADSRRASFYALKVGKLWWDEDEGADPEWDSFLDHSERANAQIELSAFSPFEPFAPLVASRDIRQSDEITINYHQYGDRVYKSERFHIPRKSPTRLRLEPNGQNRLLPEM